MHKELLITSDGSHTISVPEWNVTYHSRHGAIQESLHVFIEAGLHYCLDLPDSPDPIRIFEMGLGTGLNALLTGMEAGARNRKMDYTAVEMHPLDREEAARLNYNDTLRHQALYDALHSAPWNHVVRLSEFFTIHKINTSLQDFSPQEAFHLIYYDAFAPAFQPELWTQQVFGKLWAMLETNGVLVTYCSKGDVRRALMAAGFQVTKLPGPRGKREMLRAEKRGD